MAKIPLQEALSAPTSGGGVEEITDWELIREKYSRYLSDESKVQADSVRGIAFPRTLEELSNLLHSRALRNQTTTVSAARTGITAASVPTPDSAILSVDRMTAIGPMEREEAGDSAAIWVQAGVPLRTLNKYLAEHHPDWIFPVDPTESWAAIGGMAGTNASGARSFGYGPMRDWVLGFRACLAGGQVLDIRRGGCTGTDGCFEYSEGGELRRLELRTLPKPKTKNTIGYSLHPGVDLVDVLVGSEGTLCVFSDLLLKLCRKPEQILSCVQFFDTDLQALNFVAALRGSAGKPLAIEYFDGRSLELLRQNPQVKASPVMRVLGERPAVAVYTEIIFSSEDEFLAASDLLTELTEAQGGNPARSFAGTEERDVRELKMFRHALPEQINAVIAKRKLSIPSLHKLATDMAVPDEHLHDIFFSYQQELDRHGLEYVIFGHAGNNHFHANILPRDERELELSKQLYLQFAKQAVEWHGSVASEHGLGRLKKGFLQLQYGPEQQKILREVKNFLDPRHLLNPGVLLD